MPLSRLDQLERRVDGPISAAERRAALAPPVDPLPGEITYCRVCIASLERAIERGADTPLMRRLLAENRADLARLTKGETR